MPNVFKQFLATETIVSVAMLFSPLALAQSTGQEGSVTGVITVISGTTLTLRGDTGGLYTVLVPSARFESDDGYPLTFSGLRVGDRIRATGTFNGNGTSTTVTNLSLTTSTIEGKVETVSQSQFTILLDEFSPVSVAVSPQTVYEKDFSAATFADIKPGSTVVLTGPYGWQGGVMYPVHVRIQGDLEARMSEGKVVGPITNTGFTLRTKGGEDLSISFTSLTIFIKDGEVGNSFLLDAVLTVQVSGVWNRLTGTLSANTVELFSQKNITIKGRLTAKSGTTYTVIGNDERETVYTVHTSSAALVKNNMKPAKRGDIKIGHTLQVKGTYTTDATVITATRIKDMSLKR